MRNYIGTSGWSYPQWKGELYPPGSKSAQWLGYYAARLNSVELNASFYRPPALPTVAKWRESVPEGFRFAVKAWQAVTHEKRLRDCADELKLMQDILAFFGSAAGPLLFQLPPSFARDDALLRDFLQSLPPGRHVFEFRHASWQAEPVYTLLHEHRAALCRNHLKRWREPPVITADFAYLRLHGPQEAYKGSYSPAFIEELRDWLIAQPVEEAYVYFNNTMGGAQAVHEAEGLASTYSVRCPHSGGLLYPLYKVGRPNQPGVLRKN